MNAVIDLLLNHRSIRQFSDRPVPPGTLETLIRAGQAAATSSFIQACTVIRIDDAERRRQLAEWAGNQAYVASAPVFLVFCADMQRHRLACAMHDSGMLAGFTEQFITATVDVALFAQNLAVAAESCGLGICYIGGIRNNPDKVSEALALPELVYPVFGMCLGYPAQSPEVKPRLPLSVVLKSEHYRDEDDAAAIAEYDREVEAYYLSRSSNNRQSGWSEQIAAMLRREARPHMLAFLQQRGFLKR